MSNSSIPDQLDPDLRGLRVGLSGAIPETDEWAGRALDWEILNAVSTLADRVFSSGGYLVHGSHPSFTPRILAQAMPYAEERGEPVVTFVLSDLFAQTPLARQLQDRRYRKVLRLILVPAVVPPGHEGHGAEDPEVRNASLAAMRKCLIDEMDALVVIGGKLWRTSAHKPGTVEELELARARDLPVYPLGGFGGMSAELTVQPGFADLITSSRLNVDLGSSDVHSFTTNETAATAREDRQLDNGLTAADNEYLRTSSNYGRTIAIVSKGLEVSRHTRRSLTK